MAVVNARTLDAVKRTLYYRENAAQVPVRLPFSIVTIDEDFQGWEPMSYLGLVNERGQRLSGSNAQSVVLTRNMRLPRPAGNDNPDKFGVWEYHGV